MLKEMDSIQNPTQREINERKIIEPIISSKAKFGLGVVEPASSVTKPATERQFLSSVTKPGTGISKRGARALKKNSSKKNITRT